MILRTTDNQFMQHADGTVYLIMIMMSIIGGQAQSNGMTWCANAHVYVVGKLIPQSFLFTSLKIQFLNLFYKYSYIRS